MADTHEPQSLINEAEQAAKVGDYSTAERLLREAADLQEAGPPALRAELANTLNNLGVVCELTDNPVEAERCFRRAHQIAVDVLAPNHPFVTTARKNLEDFCAANGKDPFPQGEPQPRRAVTPSVERGQDLVTAPPLTDLLRDLMPVPPPQSAPAPTPAPPPAVSVRPKSTATAPPPELTPRASSRTLAFGLIAVALLFAVFLARSLFFREPAARDVPATTSSEPPARTAPAQLPPPAPRPAPAPTEPSKPAARAPESKPQEAAEGRNAKVDERRPSATASTSTVSVVSGELCRTLRTGGGEWRCEATGGSVRAGQLFFYTRVKSARDAVVEHRWYQGNQLRKSVDLTIAANPGSGYRTYSRNTVSSGEWRVELRTKAGEVLHEERVTVR